MIKQPVCDRAGEADSAAKVKIITCPHFAIMVGEVTQQLSAVLPVEQIQKIEKVGKSVCDIPDLIISLKRPSAHVSS